MLDINLIRKDPEGVRAGIARRGEGSVALADLEKVLELNGERLQRIHDRDAIRHEINELSGQVRDLRQAGKAEEAQELQAKSRQLGNEESLHSDRVVVLDEEIRTLLLAIPNIPAEDCPDGRSEADNPVLSLHDERNLTGGAGETGKGGASAGEAGKGGASAGEAGKGGAGGGEAGGGGEAKPPHWEFAVEMGILDLERAAKISGAMFAMFRGDGAALARALLSYGLDRNSDLYEEILPPSLVRRDTMVRTGHLPKFIDDAYEIARDDLWPIPTGEVPLTSLGEDEILDESQLPMRFMAATPCYRREAGSAGRDTRGLLRVHEFQKVEILAYATEEQARSLHEELLERAVGAVSDLGLTYRIVDICTGDLGASSARTFDVEVYAPGADRWLECSSVSWFSDYQARRANIRYRPSSGQKGSSQRGSRFVHTLNGSAVAVPRLWAAIVETYRLPDGEIAVPEALRPYLGGRNRLVANHRQPPAEK